MTYPGEIEKAIRKAWEARMTRGGLDTPTTLYLGWDEYRQFNAALSRWCTIQDATCKEKMFAGMKVIQVMEQSHIGFD